MVTSCCSLWNCLSPLLNPSGALRMQPFQPSLACYLPSSTRAGVLKQAFLVPWTGQRVGTFFIVTLKWRKTNATKHLQHQRQPLTTKHSLTQTSIVARLRNPATDTQTLLFSTHGRLAHKLLHLYTGGFFYLECPAMPLCPRNDRVACRIQLETSLPLYAPFQIPQREMFLLCFPSCWYPPHTGHSAPKLSVTCWRQDLSPIHHFSRVPIW